MRNHSAAFALFSGAALVLSAPLFAQEPAPQPSNNTAPAEQSGSAQQQGSEAQAPAGQSEAPAEAPAQPQQNGAAPQGQNATQSPNF